MEINCITRADEVENNIQCTPPKKKKPTKSQTKKEDKSKSPSKITSVAETTPQWSKWRLSPSTINESPRPTKMLLAEVRQELPKKRWLREATMEQKLDTCRTLNQSRPTVLVRAEPQPMSPPWTPTSPEPVAFPICTSTPKVPVIVPQRLATNLLTPPDSAHKSQVLIADHSFVSFQRLDEELACPLPCDDDSFLNHPLNLSQNPASSMSFE